MEIRSRKQLLLLSSCLPSSFQKSLGTNLNKSHQVSQAKGKLLGARSKRQEVSTQRKERAITHLTLLCHTASWGVTQPTGYTFHGSSYPQKILLKSSLCAGPSGTGYNPSYLES